MSLEKPGAGALDVRDHIDAIADPQARWDRLVEMNVTEQVQNLVKTSIVQRAWKREQR